MLDDYEKGAKFEQPDAKDVLVRVDEDTFPEAFRPDGRERLERLHTDVETLAQAGALRVVRQRVRGGGERMELRLGAAEVTRAYAVAVAHGYRPLRAVLDELLTEATRLLAAAAVAPQAPTWWLQYLGRVQDAARSADLRLIGIATRSRLKLDWPEVRDALTAANHFSRTVDAWARHESERLFGDSKRLSVIKARVTGILRAADPRWGSDSDQVEPCEPNDVLEAYGVRRRPATLICAGAVPMRVGTGGERTYQLADFHPVATLPSGWGVALANGVLDAGIQVVTTIENEYPFLSYIEEAGGPTGLGTRRELVVYTGGFLSEPLLDVLARIAAEGGNSVAFRHWGDADPDGLSIWWQLRCRVRRPVEIYRTTAEWVERAAIRDGKALNTREERLLRAHIGRFAAEPNPAATDLQQATALAETVLKLRMKLEQERQ
ncbi:Wadjet anti-phage system protein JetD domain-containing protein [Myxococcus xanthus]|uniref:Wadjet anti-phage system protein JetD domain-containing protein n=1 Tax=Myxococcus xanthus TaxID=34 RepID=UPI00116288E0|nr:Wadjet anti-phage system protein JetD domain-containing protein [Myxococcus xanthus]QDE81671.1 hypothetical protein BHS07_08920 [Myxococcus xanthus]